MLLDLLAAHRRLSGLGPVLEDCVGQTVAHDAAGSWARRIKKAARVSERPVALRHSLKLQPALRPLEY